MTSIEVHTNASLAACAAAEEFIALASSAMADHGSFTVALSGGETPQATYELLASKDFASRVDWRRVVVCWGDERCVPPDHRESNYRMARDALLSRVPVEEERIHRIAGEMDPEAAAAAYEETLATLFQVRAGSLPRFDLELLGLGEDGHTASLFPHTAVIEEEHRLVAAHYVEKLAARRITLTPPVLMNAAHIVFIVTGDHKAAIVQAVLEGPYDPARYPAQLFRDATGTVTWMMDVPAASRLMHSH